MEVTILDLIEAVESINLREALPDLVLGTSFELTALVKEQMYDGRLSTGDKITPEYSKVDYSKKKELLNPLPGYGTPDAFLKGNLYNAMGVSVKDDEYDIESTVDYASSKQITQYGPNLMQISDENADIYANGVLLDAIQHHITDKTGLVFE